MLKRVLNNKYLTIIILLAFLLRFIGLFPNIAHPDEGYVQIISGDLAKNILVHGDFNPRSFKYGSFIYYAQAIFYLPVLISDYLAQNANVILFSGFTSKALSFELYFPEAFRKFANTLTLVGRSQVALLGVGSVYITYLIAKKLFNKQMGLWAAFFMAVSPLHVRDSHYITTDVPFVFFLLVAFLFLIYAEIRGKVRDFFWAGFFTGFSSTVRYFPIGFLMLPFIYIFTFKKTKSWIYKVIVSIVASVAGVLIGVPFLAIDPNAPAQLASDFEKYILPWYHTSISTYAFSLLKGQFLPPALLLPQLFKPFHASYIFFLGVTPAVAIVAIFGLLQIFKMSPKKFLLLLVIPLFLFIYISFYIPSTYERLSIPILPFLAIFAGVGIHTLTKYYKKGAKISKVLVILVVITAIYFPLLKSTSATIACSQPRIQTQSVEWVEGNINDSAKIGYLTMVSVPSHVYEAWVQLEPGRELSLGEAQDKGLDHAFINAGRLDYVTYPYFNMFFIPPQDLYENSYYALVLAEYASRATTLKIIRKPFMCDFGRIYYYKLPNKLSPVAKNSLSYKFDDPNELSDWNIQNVDNTGSAKISYVKEEKGSLKYSQTSFGYTPSRVVSKTIPVAESKIYTFKFRVRTNDESATAPKVIGRIDFYNSKGPSISNKIQNVWLLINEGATPVYFEKKRELMTYQNNTNLPGISVALSNVVQISSKWQEVVVTSKATPGSELATFSVQPISSEKNTFLIDDISINEQ
jgi:4-amino-4-deoxy-L-arabinose transferase-like glycosyltransferase